MSDQFTKRQRQALVEAFKLVKGQLKPHSYESAEKFICCALDRLATKGRVSDEISNLAQQRVIEPRLEGELTLESWLGAKGVNPWVYPNMRELMHNHRQQWLDLLIKEFSDLAEVTL
jgi:hypothetical protein